jgi:hypothetical protein
MSGGLDLGAPGIYRSPVRAGDGFAPIRLDIAGFVGVALRGPVNVPTEIDSWSDFQRVFGGFEVPDGGGPERLLPYAVEAFFAQGGVRAYVVRVAPTGPHTGPDDAADAATTRFRLGPWELAAADEGSWGNRLSIVLGFSVDRSMTIVSAERGIPLPRGADVPAGSLLRLRGPGLPPAGIMRWVVEVIRPDAAGPFVAVLDEALPPSVGFECAVVTGTLRIADGDALFDRSEQLGGLGLHPAHPRFVWSRISESASLVRPVGPWNEPIVIDGLLGSVAGLIESAGEDRWQLIDQDSFFDESADGDPLDEWDRHRGVDALGRQPDIGLLCAPDLDWQWQGPTLPPVEFAPRKRTSGVFEKCTSEPVAEINPQVQFEPLAHLDPRDPVQLAELTRRQERVVEVAQLRRRFVALLDVPNGVPLPAIIRWRSGYDTSYAACYHPWLGVPREDDAVHRIIEVPPSACAAGIIAARERRAGLSWGPANELALGAVATASAISDAMHDQLHLMGINVFRSERDGFRLTAARTMSSDPDYRQLSVRRLMTTLEITLDRQSQWIIFEPNTAELRRDLTFSITQLLRGLQRAGAFAGATDADSFFVRCDDDLNPRASQELGRLVAEVGVAPASPLEYLVLRISQDAAGRVQVQPQGRAVS